MKKSISALLALVFAGAAASACAGQLAAISVVDRQSGERLRVWRHDGRNYVAGEPGKRYAIELHNRTGARVLSVVSVDGVNVVNGASAAFDQPGYVLCAWCSTQIKVWRKNADQVAAFYFTPLPDSYAARSGRPENAGVIGVALFREVVDPIAPRDQAAAAAPMAAAREERADGALQAKIGTGHGERIDSGTRFTDFRRAATQPDEVITILYDTRARLAARGIIPRSPDSAPQPVPFPGNFVPDPS